MHAAIVGIGHTEYSRDSGRSELKLGARTLDGAVISSNVRLGAHPPALGQGARKGHKFIETQSATDKTMTCALRYE